jgi:hypothetical protein
MRWKRLLRWMMWLLGLGCVGLLATTECLYRAALARVPVLPRPTEDVPLPALYLRMRWTSLERTRTPHVEPVWLGTFARGWMQIVLFKHRPEEVSPEGWSLAVRVVQQWCWRLEGAGHPRSRGPERFALALWLTRNWSAEELLAFDAEHTSLGHELSGMRAGATMLLGGEWARLDAAGMALLLAVNDAPGGRRDPWCFPDRIRAKRDWILMRLRETGGLTPEQANAALRAPLGLAPRPANWRPCPVPGEQTSE